MITRDNYEAYLLDKQEGLLSEKDAKALERFLDVNKDLKADASLVFDDNIRFGYATEEEFSDKDKLYKPVFTVSKWVKAAAIVLLVVAASYFVLMIWDNNSSEPQIAKTKTEDISIKDQSVKINTINDTVNSEKETVQSSKNTSKPQIAQPLKQIKSEEADLIADNTEINNGNEEVLQQTESEELPSIVVYKQTERIRSDNLVIYKTPETSRLKRIKDKVTEYMNTIRV
ncbi:MAG: hypothetical protein J6P44_09430 [Bacteroidales bacterium]|nr:hypothetical protein [Bacteroidales bacterium]